MSFEDARLLMGRSLTTVGYRTQPAALLFGGRRPSQLPCGKVLEFAAPLAPSQPGPGTRRPTSVLCRPPVPEAS